MKFSVLMTVYDKESPTCFSASLKSILVEQRLIPDQFVLVYDGPIGKDLREVAEEYRKSFPNEFEIVALPENVGQGMASKIGFEKCKNELIARMDSDDISYYNRFEKEIEIFKKYPDIDVVGGFITEFVKEPTNITGTRIVAEKHSDIVKNFKRRNPINNVTVMYKRKALQDIGGYSNIRANEDFNLYVRLLLGGKKFYNIQEPLVNVRVGENMLVRRGDMEIYKAWKRNQQLLLKGKIINRFEYFINCIGCYLFIKCSPKIKGLLYKYVLRKKLK